jgi:hypothetical protein
MPLFQTGKGNIRMRLCINIIFTSAGLARPLFQTGKGNIRMRLCINIIVYDRQRGKAKESATKVLQQSAF